jgi:hypothetical protein
VISRQSARLALLCGILVPFSGGGCINSAPSTERVPVPSASNRDAAQERDYVKPMPPDDWRDAPQHTPPPEPRQQ